MYKIKIKNNNSQTKIFVCENYDIENRLLRMGLIKAEMKEHISAINGCEHVESVVIDRTNIPGLYIVLGDGAMIECSACNKGVLCSQ